MEKRPLPPGLKKEKLAEIWQIGSNLSDSADVSQDQMKTEQLREYLAASLPLDAETTQLLPKGLGRLCQELRPFTGMTIGNLLLDKNTDIETIRYIKELGKKQENAASSEAERAAATALYYAAIAHALVYHEQKITEFPYQDLDTWFNSLLMHNWITPGVSELFKQAQAFCARQAEQK